MFADINQDYPIDQSLEYCLEKIEAKPFSSDFDIQLDAAEELYGIQIGFQFTFKDIQIYLQKNRKLSQGSNKTRGAAVKRADA